MTLASRRALVRSISVVAAAVAAIVGVIVRTAAAKLNMARDYAEETSALKVIQALNTAQVQYNSQFGRYAWSLTELGPSASDLISADLAAGEKQGYNFTLTGTPTGYTITAAPSALRSAGMRTFYSDQSLAIRENYGSEPATASSKEVGRGAKQP